MPAILPDGADPNMQSRPFRGNLCLAAHLLVCAPLMRPEWATIRRINVVVPLILGLEDELKLALLGHVFRISSVAVEAENLYGDAGNRTRVRSRV